MKYLILALLKKAGVALSGPVGWLASLLIDRLLIWLEKKAREIYGDIRDRLKNDSERRKDEKNSEKYQQVLNDPNKSQAELDQATSDLLNGRSGKL